MPLGYTATPPLKSKNAPYLPDALVSCQAVSMCNLVLVRSAQ